MAIKKGDFIEVEYTGMIKEDKTVFDTTSEETAKQNNLHSPKMKYCPVIIVLGENHLIKGLDEQLEGKEPGEYDFEISAEKGFGKKSASLLKLVPAKAFNKENIKPFVGLEVELDGMRGIVRTVSGGRIIVDFNHPLSGKDLLYKIKVNKIITDPAEQAKGLASLLKIPIKSVELTDKKLSIEYEKQLPPQLSAVFEEEIKRLTKQEIIQKPKASLKTMEQEQKTQETQQEKPQQQPEAAETKAEDKKEETTPEPVATEEAEQKPETTSEPEKDTASEQTTTHEPALEAKTEQAPQPEEKKEE